MGRSIFGFSVLPLLVSALLLAQSPLNAHLPSARRLAASGESVVPQSGRQRAEDLGLRARTLFKVWIPADRPEGVAGFSEEEFAPQATQPEAGNYAETPASLACVYGVVSADSSCNPLTLTTVARGGSRAIAVVDAYDYPTARHDLTAYSRQFGLPLPTTANFTVAYQGKTKPQPDPNCAANGGWNCWAAEAALDIEMAHAMAPAAHLYLVEANSANTSDLFAAITKAAKLVEAAGGGEVSMSWGGGEFAAEAKYDATFTGKNVVFFASSGDSEGTLYPAVSPNVVAVGGTTLARDPTTLNLEGELTWEDGGGGYSEYESRPAFQSKIAGLVGVNRGVPDVSAVGNPRTGVWVYISYDNTYSGTLFAWNIFGGTSIAAPLWAGIVNNAGHFTASTAAEQSLIYANAGNSAAYRGITEGSCGFYEGWAAVAGWNPCTGNGAPLGAAGK